METKIDWQAEMDGSRPVTTRDGRKVTLYCVDAPGSYPVHGRVEGDDEPYGWRKNGDFWSSGMESKLNLIQPPRRFRYEQWVNVYHVPNLGARHLTKEDADRHSGSARIACVKVIIEGEEGEGLE